MRWPRDSASTVTTGTWIHVAAVSVDLRDLIGPALGVLLGVGAEGTDDVVGGGPVAGDENVVGVIGVSGRGQGRAEGGDGQDSCCQHGYVLKDRGSKLTM